jgi:hypothetical protein
MPWIQMGIVKCYHLIFNGHFTGNICIKTGLFKEIKWHEIFEDISLPYLIQRAYVLRAGKQ